MSDAAALKAEHPATDAAPTRRGRKKARTRQEIYRTAMGLFAKRGYDRVTIEEICAGADVAKATFFLHFGNKAALLQEYNAQLAGALAEQLDDTNGTAEQQLRFIVRAFIEAGERNAPVMREMVREFLDQPALPRAVEEANRSIMDLVTAIVARGQERGEFRADFPAHVAAASLVASWGTIATWWSERPDANVAPVHDQVLDIILNGLTTG